MSKPPMRLQSELRARRGAAGHHVIGRKVGLTSQAVQQQLGVGQPDFGTLFDDMEVRAGSEACTARLLQPKAEAEVASVLAADLDDGPLDLAQVRAAVDHAVAAVEIGDSRIARWDITIADTVADNASSALFALGTRRRGLGDFEPAGVSMSMSMSTSVDGRCVSSGSGAACLGDPLNAVVWQARTLRATSEYFHAVISSFREHSVRCPTSGRARRCGPTWPASESSGSPSPGQGDGVSGPELPTVTEPDPNASRLRPPASDGDRAEAADAFAQSDQLAGVPPQPAVLVGTGLPGRGHDGTTLVIDGNHYREGLRGQFASEVDRGAGTHLDGDVHRGASGVDQPGLDLDEVADGDG